MDTLENRTYGEIAVGERAELARTVTREEIQLFAAVSGDVNPAHLDEDYARAGMFGEVIAHGMFGGALISAVLGTQLPGPGTIYVSQDLRFRRPVKLGDELIARVTCREKHDDKKRVLFDCEVVNQRGEAVIRGSAEVIAPTEKIRVARPPVPRVTIG